MCRIFYALHQPHLHSKLRQFWKHSRSLRNGTQSLDGYGVAGLNERTGKWSLYRSVSPPDADPLNDSITEKMAEHALVVGQLRNADFTPARPAIENTHPFYHKNRLFLHNGEFDKYISPEHRNRLLQSILPELRTRVRGQTDTELIFYVFLSILSRAEQSSRDIVAFSGERGCSQPTRFDVLRDSVMELFRFLDAEFRMYIANFVYADKEHSIIVHAMKNATRAEIQKHPMYLNHPAHNKGFLFSSEPISKHYEPIKMNSCYIVNHTTMESQRIDVS